jgi:hypothetical protein
MMPTASRGNAQVPAENVLLDVLRQASGEMRDFVRRVRELAAAPRGLNASHVKSLAARLAQINSIVRNATPETVATVRASSVYSEYKALLADVRNSIEPLRGQLIVRQVQIGLARFRIESARAWAGALERTR